jgi:hypothetical protein
MMRGDLRGWQPDPFGRHEFRFLSDDGKPTMLVRDGDARSYDHLPPGAPLPLQTIEPVVDPETQPGLAAEGRGRPYPNTNDTFPPVTADWRPPKREPIRVTRPVDPVHQLSPPMSRPTRYAFIVVLAAMAASALILAVMHLDRHGSSPSAASASATSTTPTAAKGTTTTTLALPGALKPSAPAAAAALIASWAAGNQAAASSVADSSAVAKLFAGRYTPGLVIDRGCSVAFSPIVCTYGPPGGAAPTDSIYEIDVVQTLGGWYVSSVTISN